MTTTLRLLLASAALAASGAAPAFDVDVAAEQARYDARETAPEGFVLNRDQGVLRGGRLALQAALGASGWAGRLEALALRGALRYDGRTQIGVPLATQSDLTLQRLQATLLAPAWPAGGGVELQPALALGALRSERAIAATPASLPTTETLQQRYAALEGQARWTFGPLALGAGARVLYPLRQRLKVDTFGVLDGYSLQPERESSTRWRLRGEWSLASTLALFAEAQHETLRFGASDGQLVTHGGQPAAFSSYPGSRQTLRSVLLGARAAF